MTANGLFDFIDRRVERAAAAGGGVQRPMQYGHAAGRMILVHDAARAAKATPSGGDDGGAVIDSGALVMLGDDFFDDARVRSSGDEVVVEVPSADAAADAALAGLTPKFGGRSVAYAHLNDGGDARVLDASSASEGGRQVWTVRLKRHEESGGATGGFSFNSGGRTFGPLDFAVIKARRVLLGENTEEERYTPGAGRRASTFDPMTMALAGRGDADLVRRCPPRDLRPLLDEIGEIGYLRRVRLVCVYLLRRLDIVERVLDLRLGPVEPRRCRSRSVACVRRCTTTNRPSRSRWTAAVPSSREALAGAGRTSAGRISRHSVSSLGPEHSR